MHAHPPIGHRLRRRRHSADRAVLAEVVTTLGSIPIAEYGTPSTPELPAAVRQVHQGARRAAARQPRRADVARDVFAAYYKMETIEHFAKISLVARLLGRENLMSREEVERLQGLRGIYGIAAPAPICADPRTRIGRRCVPVLEAPATVPERRCQAPRRRGCRAAKFG